MDVFGWTMRNNKNGKRLFVSNGHESHQGAA
jgi:hypothetical protein